MHRLLVRTFQQDLKLFRQSICVWASARKLDAIGCDVLRTDLNGDITISADGKNGYYFSFEDAAA